MKRFRSRFGLLLLLLAGPAAAETPPSPAREYLESIRPSPDLQRFLDETIEALEAADPKLRHTDVRVALLDLGRGDPPLLAHHHGETPIYPASVVKFAYLMAAYAWQEEGRLTIDPGLDGQLHEMIYHSSNQATRRVFARLTDTEPGPELPPDAYRVFRDHRLAVKRWLESLGITDLHCVNPTYDGNGDLFGRDAQFLRDRTVTGGLRSGDGKFPNRQAMTAVGTAKLLALLATDRALSARSSADVRRRMRRDPRQQRHLASRIAGGAARLPGLEVYAKSGTWGPDFADAGIVRQPASGRQIVVVVFTEAWPPYRGDFIANLTERAAARLLVAPAGDSARPR
jgi:beta-lactamase class A